MNRLLALTLVVTASLPINAKEITVQCTLVDERSQEYCTRNPSAAAVVCQRAYAIDNDLKLVRELNPGRILPEFKVREWTPSQIDLVRVTKRPDSEVEEHFRTNFNRITGRMSQWSEFINSKTGNLLMESELKNFEADQVRFMGLFGYLDRTTTVGTCKVIEKAF